MENIKLKNYLLLPSIGTKYNRINSLFGKIDKEIRT